MVPSKRLLCVCLSREGLTPNAASFNTLTHDTQQKAEFFYLKAEFLAKLGFGEDANGAYSTAVSTWDGLGRGWAGWGSFCETMHSSDATSPSLQQPPAPQVDPASKDASIPRQPHSWPEFALICFLQAMRAQPSLSTSLVPRVLLLLYHDDSSPHPSSPAPGGASTATIMAVEEPAAAGAGDAGTEKQMISTFDTFSENVPMWVWIPWLPQLLVALSRSEGAHLKSVLAKLASLYPQAVYYPLRNFIFEQRLLAYSRSRKKSLETSTAASSLSTTAAASNTSTSPSPSVSAGPQAVPAAATAASSEQATALLEQQSPSKDEGDHLTAQFDKKKRQGLVFAEEVMGIMKNSFPAVVAKMEEMIKEITKCVTITTEERLLQVHTTCLTVPARPYLLTDTTTSSPSGVARGVG
jgi:hypothetical protein